MSASRKPDLTSKLSYDLVQHFAASGLDEVALGRMQVAYVPPHGDAFVKVPVPAARIPYFDLDGAPTGFYRLRTLADWVPAGDTKPRKYMQAANSGNHLYLPPLLDAPWRAVAADVAIPLLITEGEKKAACACVHGRHNPWLNGMLMLRRRDYNWRRAGWTPTLWGSLRCDSAPINSNASHLQCRILLFPTNIPCRPFV